MGDAMNYLNEECKAKGYKTGKCFIEKSNCPQLALGMSRDRLAISARLRMSSFGCASSIQH